MSILTDFTGAVDRVAAPAIETSAQNPVLNAVENSTMLPGLPTPGMKVDTTGLPAAANDPALEASLKQRMPYTAAALKDENVMKPNWAQT